MLMLILIASVAFLVSLTCGNIAIIMILGVIGNKFLCKVDALLSDTRRYLGGRA